MDRRVLWNQFYGLAILERADRRFDFVPGGQATAAGDSASDGDVYSSTSDGDPSSPNNHRDPDCHVDFYISYHRDD